MDTKQLPLAVRLRPRSLTQIVGQSHILGEGKLLQRAILAKRIPSLLLWGPTGCGKTTLGFLVAKDLDADFEYLNAAFSTTAAVKKIIEQAREKLEKNNRRTVIFIDEIHRFNKLQQEALVPDTELGYISLVGATIYKPYYYIIPSLISRSVVAEFKPLSKEDTITLLKRAITDKEEGLGNMNVDITNKALEYIAISASGDARKALTALEIGVLSSQPNQNNKILFDLEVAKESIQKSIGYDRKDGYHYDTISAFIKSIRGSDPDSALYWLAKMIKAGEDPRFIARRLVILASEDIGNADSMALVLATSCFNAVEFVGSPESDLILAHTTTYLATAAKSNASYLALSRAKQDVEEEDTQEVPEHIKTNAKDYKYPHSFGGYVQQNYGAKKQYYFPTEFGQEKRIKDFLEELKK